MESMSEAKMIVWARGFQYVLDNGYKLSCAFGHGNYCSNREDKNADLSNNGGWKVDSPDFEVAVFEPNGIIVDLISDTDDDGDTWTDQVIGWVPASALPALISALKFWPVREKFKHEPEKFEQILRVRCRIFKRVCEDYIEKDKKKKSANV